MLYLTRADKAKFVHLNKKLKTNSLYFTKNAKYILRKYRKLFRPRFNVVHVLVVKKDSRRIVYSRELLINRFQQCQRKLKRQQQVPLKYLNAIQKLRKLHPKKKRILKVNRNYVRKPMRKHFRFNKNNKLPLRAQEIIELGDSDDDDDQYEDIVPLVIRKRPTKIDENIIVIDECNSSELEPVDSDRDIAVLPVCDRDDALLQVTTCDQDVAVLPTSVRDVALLEVATCDQDVASFPACDRDVALLQLSSLNSHPFKLRQTTDGLQSEAEIGFENNFEFDEDEITQEDSILIQINKDRINAEIINKLQTAECGDNLNEEDMEIDETITMSMKSPTNEQLLANDIRSSPSDEQLLTNDIRSSPSDEQLLANATRSSPSDEQLLTNDIRSCPSDEQLLTNDIRSSPSDEQLLTNDIRSSPSDEKLLANDIRSSDEESSGEEDESDDSNDEISCDLDCTEKETPINEIEPTEDVNKQIREQLKLLQMGRRNISFLGDRKSGGLDRSTSLLQTPEDSRPNTPPLLPTATVISSAEKLTPKKCSNKAQIMRRRASLRSATNILNLSDDTTSPTNNSLHKKNFIDSLINKLKPNDDLEDTPSVRPTLHRNSRISISKDEQKSSSPKKATKKPNGPEIDNYIDDNSNGSSNGFLGFSENDTNCSAIQYGHAGIPGLLPTPIVPNASDVSSAFVSEKLDIFMKENALENVANVALPAKKAHDEALVNEKAEPPSLNFPDLPMDMEKPRTVAEKRMLLETKTDIKYLMIENESSVYRELRKRSKPNASFNNDWIKRILDNDVPFTRDCWRAACWLGTDMGKFYYQTIRSDGEEIKIFSGKGNNRKKMLCELDNSKEEKQIVTTCSQTCKQFNLQNVKINNLSAILPPIVMSTQLKPTQKNDNKLVKRTDNTKQLNTLSNSTSFFKPGPLSRKYITTTRSSVDMELGPVQIYNMPSVELELWPKINRPLPDIVKPYLKLILPHECITPEWAKFAVSTVRCLPKPVRNRRKWKKALKIEDIDPGSFVFNIPYRNDQSKVLIRQRRKVLQTNYTKDLNASVDCALTFADKLKPTNKLGHEVANILGDMINSVAISLNEAVILNEVDKPAKGDKKSDNSRSLSKSPGPNLQMKNLTNTAKSGRMIKELKRLNATIIDAFAAPVKENCTEDYCKLGCLCESLTVPKIFNAHCRKVACMFECNCTKIRFSPKRFEDALHSNDMIQLRDKATAYLAKEEKDFSATVVLSNDKTIYISTRENVRKRNTKVPKRYSDFENEFHKAEEINDIAPKPLAVTNQQNFVERLNHCNVVLTDLKDLDVYQPWCMVHCLYKCFCQGRALEGRPFKFTDKNATSGPSKCVTVHKDAEEMVAVTKKRQYTFEKDDESKQPKKPKTKMSPAKQPVPTTSIDEHEGIYSCARIRYYFNGTKRRQTNAAYKCGVFDKEAQMYRSLLESHIKRCAAYSAPLDVVSNSQNRKSDSPVQITNKTIEESLRSNTNSLLRNQLRSPIINHKATLTPSPTPSPSHQANDVREKSSTAVVVVNPTAPKQLHVIDHAQVSEGKFLKPIIRTHRPNNGQQFGVSSDNPDLKSVNRLVTITMQGMSKKQKIYSITIPKPVEKKFDFVPWSSFVDAFRKESIYVWKIELDQKVITMAVTVENCVPIVSNAKSVINIEVVEYEKLPVIGKMLRDGVKNDKTVHLATLLFGGTNYWRIIGFIHSEQEYLYSGVRAKPTPETNPKLATKIDLLFRIMQGIRTRAIEQKMQRQVVARKAAPKKVIHDHTNIPIVNLTQFDLASIIVPLPVVGDHRWFMLTMGLDFTHIYLPAWRSFLRFQVIQEALIRAKREKKTVKISSNDVRPDVYAACGVGKKIFFGPYKKDDQFNLLLYHSFEGRMMQLEDYVKVSGKQFNISDRTTGCWLYMTDNNISIVADSAAQVTSKNTNDDEDDDDDDDCMIVEETNENTLLESQPISSGSNEVSNSTNVTNEFIDFVKYFNNKQTSPNETNVSHSNASSAHHPNNAAATTSTSTASTSTASTSTTSTLTTSTSTASSSTNILSKKRSISASSVSSSDDRLMIIDEIMEQDDEPSSTNLTQNITNLNTDLNNSSLIIVPPNPTISSDPIHPAITFRTEPIPSTAIPSSTSANIVHLPPLSLISDRPVPNLITLPPKSMLSRITNRRPSLCMPSNMGLPPLQSTIPNSVEKVAEVQRCKPIRSRRMTMCAETPVTQNVGPLNPKQITDNDILQKINNSIRTHFILKPNSTLAPNGQFISKSTVTSGQQKLTDSTKTTRTMVPNSKMSDNSKTLTFTSRCGNISGQPKLINTKVNSIKVPITTTPTNSQTFTFTTTGIVAENGQQKVSTTTTMTASTSTCTSTNSLMPKMSTSLHTQTTKMSTNSLNTSSILSKPVTKTTTSMPENSTHKKLQLILPKPVEKISETLLGKIKLPQPTTTVTLESNDKKTVPPLIIKRVSLPADFDMTPAEPKRILRGRSKTLVEKRSPKLTRLQMKKQIEKINAVCDKKVPIEPIKKKIQLRSIASLTYPPEQQQCLIKATAPDAVKRILRMRSNTTIGGPTPLNVVDAKKPIQPIKRISNVNIDQFKSITSSITKPVDRSTFLARSSAANGTNSTAAVTNSAQSIFKIPNSSAAITNQITAINHSSNPIVINNFGTTLTKARVADVVVTPQVTNKSDALNLRDLSEPTAIKMSMGYRKTTKSSNSITTPRPNGKPTTSSSTSSLPKSNHRQNPNKIATIINIDDDDDATVPSQTISHAKSLVRPSVDHSIANSSLKQHGFLVCVSLPDLGRIYALKLDNGYRIRMPTERKMFHGSGLEQINKFLNNHIRKQVFDIIPSTLEFSWTFEPNPDVYTKYRLQFSHTLKASMILTDHQIFDLNGDFLKDVDDVNVNTMGLLCKHFLSFESLGTHDRHLRCMTTILDASVAHINKMKAKSEDLQRKKMFYAQRIYSKKSMLEMMQQNQKTVKNSVAPIVHESVTATMIRNKHLKITPITSTTPRLSSSTSIVTSTHKLPSTQQLATINYNKRPKPTTYSRTSLPGKQLVAAKKPQRLSLPANQTSLGPLVGPTRHPTSDSDNVILLDSSDED